MDLATRQLLIEFPGLEANSDMHEASRHHATAIHELMATAAQGIKCEIQAPFFT